MKRQRPDLRLGPVRAERSEDASPSSHPMQQTRIGRHPPSSRRVSRNKAGLAKAAPEALPLANLVPPSVGAHRRLGRADWLGPGCRACGSRRVQLFWSEWGRWVT